MFSGKKCKFCRYNTNCQPRRRSQRGQKISAAERLSEQRKSYKCPTPFLLQFCQAMKFLSKIKGKIVVQWKCYENIEQIWKNLQGLFLIVQIWVRIEWLISMELCSIFSCICLIRLNKTFLMQPSVTNTISPT